MLKITNFFIINAKTFLKAIHIISFLVFDTKLAFIKLKQA